MKKYKLYGLGNALLDYEYKINDQILKKLNQEKGTMLLNEYDKHQLIHTTLKEMRPPEKILPGGSVANSVYAMAQFGDSVCFTGKVSNDDSGKNFIDCLDKSGVKTHITQSSNNTSGECLVLVTPDNERTMNTYLGSSCTLNVDDVSLDCIKNSEYLLIEGYLVSSDNTLEVCIDSLKKAKENNVKSIITLSDPNIVSIFRNNILKLFSQKSDILFCNEQEALNFSQTTSLKAAKDFLKEISEIIIITRGKKGVTCYANNESFSVDGINVVSKDFTGAGDMFLGAFMHKFKSHNFLESLEFANYCASKIIQIYGAKFHNSADYTKLIK